MIKLAKVRQNIFTFKSECSIIEAYEMPQLSFIRTKRCYFNIELLQVHIWHPKNEAVYSAESLSFSQWLHSGNDKMTKNHLY